MNLFKTTYLMQTRLLRSLFKKELIQYNLSYKKQLIQNNLIYAKQLITNFFLFYKTTTYSK